MNKLIMSNEIYFIVVSISIIFGISIGYFIIERQKKINARFKTYKKELSDNLTIAFENKTITLINDLKDFVDGYENINELQLDYPFCYIELMTRVKYNISVKKSYKNFTQENLLSTVNDIIKGVNELIVDHNLKEPFQDVPTSERNLLVDVLELSKKKDNKVYFEKLRKLGELIKIKEETFVKLGNENNDSLKLAKRSYILTIVFFIISLIISYYSFINK